MLRKVARAVSLRPSSVIVLKLFMHDNRRRTVKEIANDAILSMSSSILAVRELVSRGILSFEKNDEVYYRLEKSPEQIVSELKADLLHTIDEYFRLVERKA